VTVAATADLVATAAATGGAVLAFNVVTIEHAEGIAAGVESAGAPAILQISENTIAFHGGRPAPLLAACAQIARLCATPLAIHLDHLKDTRLISEAITTAAGLGATSLMIDAAHLPYADNVEHTRGLTRAAHAAGLWVEAELGEIGGKLNAHALGARTDPDEAASFTAATGVDALAVAVGSSHAMTTREAQIDPELISRLAARVSVPLVLHGSSGVGDDDLRLAVDAGIRKLNVGTALNLVYTGAIRNILAVNGNESDPRPYLAAGREAISIAVADLCRVVATGVMVGETVAAR
jgi:fructose-bisphosphate aldolase, class II